MRSVRILLCAAVLSALCAGCAGNPRQGAVAVVDQKPPREIVETLFTAFRDKNAQGFEPYFSKRIAPGLVARYIEGHSVNEDVGDFQVIGAKIQGDRARVELKYAFRAVRVKGKEVPPNEQKDEQTTARIQLGREGKQWRIRAVGEAAIDEKVEKNLFMECLNVVMDARIVQEYYRDGHTEYAGGKTDLNRILPLQINACASLEVAGSSVDDYLLVAKTNNDPPCEIRANSRSVAPRAFDQCGAPMSIALMSEKRVALPLPKGHHLDNTDSDIVSVIYEHARAVENKDYDLYLNTYHPDSILYRNVKTSKDVVKKLIHMVDIKTDIRETVVVRKSDKEATVQAVEITTAGRVGDKTREKKEEHNTYLLKKDKGKWKIFDKRRTGGEGSAGEAIE